MRVLSSARVPALALLVIVYAATQPLRAASISISPQTVTLKPGVVHQFDVHGERGKVSWKATGGSINSRGLYKAGTTAGSFKVQVTNKGMTATAIVVIAAPAPAPPPPPPPPVEDSGDSGVTIFPGTAVAIAPGESIQAAVDAHAEGTVFVIKAGVHRRQAFRPKSDTSFIGEPGAILDGEDATERAILGQNVNNVTIRGLRITRYAPPTTTGALDAIDTTGWVVEHNEIDNNVNGLARSYGIRLGSQMIVRGNKIHHNGYVGIDGYRSYDTLIEGNDIYMNPPAVREDSISEASNLKCFKCGRLIVRNNYFHDAPFRGIWVDTCAPDITIEGNRVVNHGKEGIWYEVSYRGVVRNNYVENAGYNSYYSTDWLRSGGITVTNSPDVTVTGNTVVNSLNGIIGLQAASYVDGPYGKSELRNLLVQGNTIVMPKGQSGLAENIGTNAVYVSWNNRFEGNQYQLLTNATPFYWMGQAVDEHGWQGFGQDAAAAASSFAR
jgi:parallel beta-helix repeat protein